MASAPALRVQRDGNGNFLFSICRYATHRENWSYTPEDFRRLDEAPDFMFYATPRYITYIDSLAIEKLKWWYSMQLPRTGSILDLCAGSRSHYPYEVESAVWNKQLEVLGIGMNPEELRVNSVLQAASSRKVHDLNREPNVIHLVRRPNLQAVTCALGIEYLTAPLEVLRSLRACMVRGAKVHIAVSNVSSWQKAIAKWRIGVREEQMQMVRGFGKIHFVLLQREEGVRNTPGYRCPLYIATAINEEAYCNGWHNDMKMEDGSSDRETKNDDNEMTPGSDNLHNTAVDSQSDDNGNSGTAADPMLTDPNTSEDTAMEVKSNGTDDPESFDTAVEAQGGQNLRQCCLQ